MKIRIQVTDNAPEFFCHPEAFSRADFGSAEIERAVNQALESSGWQICRDGVLKKDESAAAEFWISMTNPPTDAWQFTTAP